MSYNYNHFEDCELTRAIYRVFMTDLLDDDETLDEFHAIAEARLAPYALDTFRNQFLSMERNYASVYSQAYERAFATEKRRQDCRGHLFKPNARRICRARMCPTCLLGRLLGTAEILQEWCVEGTSVLSTTVANKAVLTKVEQ